MTDLPVRTRVLADGGWLEFQDYFVRMRQAPDVRAVSFDGMDAATATPEVRDALAEAGIVVVCPSNPVVSIGPILAVPGMRDAMAAARARGVGALPRAGLGARRRRRGR